MRRRPPLTADLTDAFCAAGLVPFGLTTVPEFGLSLRSPRRRSGRSAATPGTWSASPAGPRAGRRPRWRRASCRSPTARTAGGSDPRPRRVLRRPWVSSRPGAPPRRGAGVLEPDVRPRRRAGGRDDPVRDMGIAFEFAQGVPERPVRPAPPRGEPPHRSGDGVAEDRRLSRRRPGAGHGRPSRCLCPDRRPPPVDGLRGLRGDIGRAFGRPAHRRRRLPQPGLHHGRRRASPGMDPTPEPGRSGADDDPPPLRRGDVHWGAAGAVAAFQALGRVSSRIEALFQDLDVLVTPMLSGPPPRLGAFVRPITTTSTAISPPSMLSPRGPRCATSAASRRCALPVGLRPRRPADGGAAFGKGGARWRRRKNCSTSAFNLELANPLAPLRPDRGVRGMTGGDGPAARPHHQAVRQPDRQRPGVAGAGARRGAGAAGRERRRQDDADEHPVRPLCRRRGGDRGVRQAAAAGPAARGDRGRDRHGTPALHAGGQPDQSSTT